ncbi:MAG: M3 family metallopeptidase [Arcanobacterium sp.]|nr:M3 family metallopeptidase [Arcanobacterium sp.]
MSTNAEKNSSNPLLSRSTLPYQVPMWAEIKPEHIAPAFEVAMAEQLAGWEQVASAQDAPTIENTILVLEDCGRKLDEVANIAFTLFSSIGGPELDEIQAEIGPKLSEHYSKFRLDERIYNRLQALQAAGKNGEVTLDSESAHYLAEEITAFERGGITLSPAEKEQLANLDTEISKATIEFGQRTVQAMTDAELSFTPEEVSAGALSGLSSVKLEGLRDTEGNYRLSIDNFTNQALLTELDNPETRAKLLAASLERGLGKHPESDTRELVLKLALLRAQRAELLGRPHHAQIAAESAMAGSTAAVMPLLESVAAAALKKAKLEAEDLATRAGKPLAAADWLYYREQARSELGVDDAQLAPYFELNSVVENGIFFAANKLFGITFHERTDLPGYLPSVRTWEVRDENSETIAIFQADYYRRNGKHGGAWMNSLVVGAKHDGTIPVIMNNCNYPEPAAGEPCLLTWDQVITVFHEFGHALHGMLSETKYRSLSGTAVTRDFVETPSQMNEMWATNPIVLRNYARHYETGEIISEELVEKIIAAEKFGQGFETSEQLFAALLDQAWHQLGSNEIPDDVEKFEAEALSRFGIDYELIPPRYRSAYFNHTFGGGYDAQYYAYTWAEALAADIENWYRTTGAKDSDGGLNREAGQKVRDEILSRGNTRPAMDSFKAVLGREPRPEAVLERRGLI